MKRCLVLFLTVFCLAMASDATAKEMYVQLEAGRIRAEAKRYAPIQKTVPYGTPLTIVASKGSWFEVTGAGTKGWITEASLTKKKLKALTGQEAAMSKVSGKELATGSKGFTKEIENNYRAKNKEVKFDWIDKMVTDMKVSLTSCRKFLAGGGLKVTVDEGGAE